MHLSNFELITVGIGLGYILGFGCIAIGGTIKTLLRVLSPGKEIE